MGTPTEYADHWLETHGYPLEYQVAKAMRQAGYVAWQGLHYKDTEGDRRARDIDVVASLPAPIEATGEPAVVEFVIEVKHSHEPWLVLTSQTPATPTASSAVRYRLANRLAAQALKGITHTPPVPSLLTIPERHGFNVVQMVKSEEASRPNPAYIALSSVVKAAQYRVNLFSTNTSTTPALAMPLIVVGGSLVRLGYDDEGERILDEVVWQRITWSGSTVAGPTIVDVVQSDHLGTWARNAFGDAEQLRKGLSEWVTTPG
jgi:hypothetical protein